MNFGIVQTQATHLLHCAAQCNQRIPEREGIAVKCINTGSQRSIPIALDCRFGELGQVALFLLGIGGLFHKDRQPPHCQQCSTERHNVEYG